MGMIYWSLSRVPFPGKQSPRSPSRKFIVLCSQEHTNRCRESVGGRTD